MSPPSAWRRCENLHFSFQNWNHTSKHLWDGATPKLGWQWRFPPHSLQFGGGGEQLKKAKSFTINIVFVGIWLVQREPVPEKRENVCLVVSLCTWIVLKAAQRINLLRSLNSHFPNPWIFIEWKGRFSLLNLVWLRCWCSGFEDWTTVMYSSGGCPYSWSGV